MGYKEHLHSLTQLGQADQNRIVRKLIHTTPFGYWPDGMPASIDPKLILIGVSPGNSPMPETRTGSENPPEFSSDPCVIKSDNNHFYYPDGSGYWAKLRYLCNSYFTRYEPDFTERDSISLTTHLNLGTGSAGSASKKCVEKEIVAWVSNLLNSVHDPDLVILFGVTGILQDREVSSWWNHASGLTINWNQPDRVFKFDAYKKRTYIFRQWNVVNANNKRFQVVIWPNHPSRSPFTNFDIWKSSVNDFLDKYGPSA